MVGTSAAIEDVREMIRRVAWLPSTVAIYGESGTGKELVARNIHQLSGRSEKPFVTVNCGSIPENLLESELFGHTKGAFTGASRDKEGLFVVADGGTLFLDEIGEMPLSLQVKLLRVLGDSLVTPLGGTRGTVVDVRLLSATKRNLKEMAVEGTFREDLYYRLNVIPISVPPLRNHTDDIPLLVQHFAISMAERLNRQAIECDEESIAILCAYHWPGNIRELENIMERALALCQGEVITAADISTNVREHMSTTSDRKHRLQDTGLDLGELIAKIEVDLIEQALTWSRHSQKRAAELLGLSARSLRYRLQKYELDG
jgi:two-component system response regulator PilR (NtrC family)